MLFFVLGLIIFTGVVLLYCPSLIKNSFFYEMNKVIVAVLE